MNTNYLNTLKAVAIMIPLTWMAPSKAVTMEVDVDITLPDMIVVYAYTDIDLTLTEAGLISLLPTGCTTAACGVDTPPSVAGADSLDKRIDLNIGSNSSRPGDFSGSSTLVLANSWGV